MRITIIEPDGQGGLFHFAYQLSDALAAQGHSVRLITSSDPEMPGDGARFELIPAMRLWPRTEVAAHTQSLLIHRRFGRLLRRSWRGLKLTAAWMRVLRETRVSRPDSVVISMVLHPHILFLITRMIPRDVVLGQICHEFIDRDRTSGISGASLGARASAALMERLDRIFFLSDATRQDFLGAVPFPADRTTKIPHGSQRIFPEGSSHPAALRASLGIDPSRPVLLFFGVLRPSKGIEDLIEAFAIGRARETAHLVIAGRATGFIDPDALERRIDKLGLRDRVTLVNAYVAGDLVQPYFEMARAVVLPYRTASASGVLHTAYHFARAVVVTAVGGLAEDVVDGRTGLVVPPGDVVALADAIDKIMLNESLAVTLGTAGKALAETAYTWDIAATAVASTLDADSIQRHGNTATARSNPEWASRLKGSAR